MKNYLIYILLAVVATLCSCSSDSPDNVEPRLLTLSATDITRTQATLSGKCSVADGVAMPRLWFSYGSDQIGQGSAAAAAFLEKNPEMTDSIVKEIIARHKPDDGLESGSETPKVAEQ